MKVINYSNQRTLFFISGMFGGDWVWSQCRSHIGGVDHIVMADPLCAVSHSIDELIELISNKINSHHGKITLVGSSLGGMIALAIAKKFPNKIEGVMMAGTAGFEKVDLGIKLSPRRADAVADEIMSMVFNDKSVMTDEVLSSVAGEFRHNFKPIINLIRESERMDGESILQAVRCPVYAIWGDKDVVTPLSFVSKAFKRLGVSLTVLKDCGHCPMYEQPEAFARWVNLCLADGSTVEHVA